MLAALDMTRQQYFWMGHDTPSTAIFCLNWTLHQPRQLRKAVPQNPWLQRITLVSLEETYFTVQEPQGRKKTW
jgi:hypothetical protein